MIVVEVFVVSSDLARLDRVIAGGARQVGIGLGDPLTQRIVAIVIVAGAGGQGALKQPGQPALAPGSGLALIGSGAAHGVVGDGSAATYILPPSPPGVKKKPPSSGGSIFPDQPYTLPRGIPDLTLHIVTAL